MKKINVAELLRGCPSGMELDCTIFNGKVYFEGIDDNNFVHPIKISVNLVNIEHLDIYGQYNTRDYAECVIFPKGKTTWEGFVPPCKFKDGDIIFTHANCLKVGLGNTWISIFQEKRNGGVATYVDYAEDGDGFYSYNEDKGLLCMEEDIMRQRFATEEEKAKLFQAIKENGYKWNAETKTLEKLVEPKFKVGDKIRHKCPEFRGERIIKNCNDTGYFTTINDWIGYKNQDDWELVSNKFDINTLKPFDKVLVRNKSNEVWTANFYSHYDATSDKPFICVGWSEMNEYRYCIPYEVNNELLGTTNNTEEYGSR